MNAYLSDPYVWGLLLLTVLAVVVYVLTPLLEMAGWMRDLPGEGPDLPPWLVVVGGWVMVVMAVWALVEVWRGLGWLVGR